MQVVEFITNIEIRMLWDGQNYDSLKEVKGYAMNTKMFHIKLKH